MIMGYLVSQVSLEQGFLIGTYGRYVFTIFWYAVPSVHYSQDKAVHSYLFSGTGTVRYGTGTTCTYRCRVLRYGTYYRSARSRPGFYAYVYSLAESTRLK